MYEYSQLKINVLQTLFQNLDKIAQWNWLDCFFIPFLFLSMFWLDHRMNEWKQREAKVQNDK